MEQSNVDNYKIFAPFSFWHQLHLYLHSLSVWSARHQNDRHLVGAFLDFGQWEYNGGRTYAMK